MLANRWDTIADFLADWLGEQRLPTEQQGVMDRYYRDYRRHFGKYIRHHYSNQILEVMHLLNSGAQSLLEVGTGCGTEALWFAIHGASVVSIDISARRLEVARARKKVIEEKLGCYLDVEFREQSFLDLKEPGRFNIIWMEQAFHHLEPRSKVYSAVFQALKPGGYVVVSEANAWNPFLQTKLFLQRGVRTRINKTFANGRVESYGNERVTIPLILKKEFRRERIDPISVRYFRIFPNRPWSDYLLAWEPNTALHMFPFLYTHFNYVGRKTQACTMPSS